MDRGAWWPMVHKAHPCQTGLKHMSTRACKYKDTKNGRPSPPYNLLTPALSLSLSLSLSIYIYIYIYILIYLLFILYIFLFVHLSIAYLP